MIAQTYSAGLFGLDGYLVTVEACDLPTAQGLEVVGLPDNSVKEAKNRVQTAILNSGIAFVPEGFVINLAPADRKKEGSGFDLAILLSLLKATGAISPRVNLSGRCFIGELSLSGELRPVPGVVSFAMAAKEAGMQELYVPVQNAQEGALIDGIAVYGVPDVRTLIDHLTERELLEVTVPDKFDGQGSTLFGVPDFADVHGQTEAKEALEIAAAGGHNILMLGAPGSGKSMLARRLPGILPCMTEAEALETTRIYSVAGLLCGERIGYRPFRSPHHTLSAVSMTGGGKTPRPGEISLSHNGVLFLDELPEFSKSMLETLRQPLEDGEVKITRVAGRATFPSSFMLVCAMNPCKCGYFGDPSRHCTCSKGAVRAYLDRISGPILDRIDLHIEVQSLTYDELNTPATEAETSASMRKRVEQARKIATERYQKEYPDITCNAKLHGDALRKFCALDEEGTAFLRDAFSTFGMSARAHDRILKVARTIADLCGAENIAVEHLAQALMYRNLEKKYWQK